MKTKRCTICNEIKPLEGFEKHKQMIDGRRNQCKKCRYLYKEKVYYKHHPDQIRKRTRNYRRNHPEKFRNYGEIAIKKLMMQKFGFLGSLIDIEMIQREREYLLITKILRDKAKKRGTKICRKCGNIKPFEDFEKGSRKCKICEKQIARQKYRQRKAS